MTTKLRRITIALPPDLDKAVKELAEVQNRPQAGIIIEYLSELAPTMQGMVTISKQIKAGRTSEAKRTMTHVFGDTLGKMMQMELGDKVRKK